MTKRRLLKITQSALAVAILASGVAVAYKAITDVTSEYHAALQARATRLYSMERANQASFPANKLRALSVALEFHDDRGAEEILSALEKPSAD